MKVFDIVVTEQASVCIDIQAETYEEACEVARQMYEKNEITITDRPSVVID